MPNPAIPAAFKEWSIPIPELPPEGRRLYEHDVREARRLLAEAGYPNGFKTTLETTADFGPDWMDALQMWLAQLKTVGIEAELKLKEFGAFVASTAQGGSSTWRRASSAPTRCPTATSRSSMPPCGP